MLDVELKYLESHKDELLKQYGGKFLVISGEQVTGPYDTMEAALEGAAALHGLKNVLIRRPTEGLIGVSLYEFLDSARCSSVVLSRIGSGRPSPRASVDCETRLPSRLSHPRLRSV